MAFQNHAILLMIFTALIFYIRTLVLATLPPKYPVAKSNCTDRCGDISIPYPFGTTQECYQDLPFFVTCNETFRPPKLFSQNSNVEIKDISLDGQLQILQFITHYCYDRDTNRTSHNRPQIELPVYLTVNNTANKFTVVGCDSYGFISGQRLNRHYRTGCISTCEAIDDVSSGSCTGSGCCQTSIPEDVWKVTMIVNSFDDFALVGDFNNCSYGFLVEESAFKFSPDNLTNLKDVESLPFVVDWAIGNGTCEEARTNSSTYACVSPNSECYKPDNGYGYRCRCKKGYQGNPYLTNGCQDVNECEDPILNICQRKCENTPGDFRCVCPKGYNGDGKKNGKGCIRVESPIYKFAAGIALMIIVMLLSACWVYLELRRRRLSKMKQKFFLQNGGILLQQKLMTKKEKQPSPEMAKIFSSSELEKATKNFHNSMIIGQGGYGTVYKGILPDKSIVAIKKPKLEVDPTQIEQFINEVIVLSRINHRNVVRLLGCCLETQVPLLVYEFICNGTLYDHIHDHVKAQCLSWDTRLSIAAETAGVLSYLHSSASIPIIHRDVKSANILLDHTFTAKVSDFGASRLVPLDQTMLSTMVQGTFGYLDPEYLQTNQLTEKSDVYSFGVVLLELLTGRKALSYDKTEHERNLANFFLSTLRQERLFEILDDGIICERNREQLIEVARLAKGCLNVRGEDRPSMKEVAMELEGLRIPRKHSWVHNIEDEESFLGEDIL